MEAPKISLPGWRIEQRFSPGVLIGNWSEERHRVKIFTFFFFSSLLLVCLEHLIMLLAAFYTYLIC